MTVFCKSERLLWVSLPAESIFEKKKASSRPHGKKFLMELLNLGHAELFWVSKRGGPDNDLDRCFEWKKIHSLTDKIFFELVKKNLNRIFFKKVKFFLQKKKKKSQ